MENQASEYVAKEISTEEVRDRMRAEVEAREEQKPKLAFDGSNWREVLDHPDAFADYERAQAICNYISSDERMHEVAKVLNLKPMAKVRDIVRQANFFSSGTGGKKGDIIRRFVVDAKNYNRDIRRRQAMGMVDFIGFFADWIDRRYGWVNHFYHAFGDHSRREKIEDTRIDILACAVAEGREDDVAAFLDCVMENRMHDLLGGDFNLRMQMQTKEYFPETPDLHAVRNADYHGAIPLLIEKLRERGEAIKGLMILAILGEVVGAYNGKDELVFPATDRGGNIRFKKAVVLDVARRGKEVLATKGIEDRCLQEAVQYLEWLAEGKGKFWE